MLEYCGGNGYSSRFSSLDCIEMGKTEKTKIQVQLDNSNKISTFCKNGVSSDETPNHAISLGESLTAFECCRCNAANKPWQVSPGAPPT